MKHPGYDARPMISRLFRRRTDPYPPVPVVLYTRPGCHLCEVMKAQLEAARLSAHELREVDISTDAELETAHGRSIPVLEVGGRVAFKGRLDPELLPRKFERLAEAWRRSRGGA